MGQTLSLFVEESVFIADLQKAKKFLTNYLLFVKYVV